MWGMYANGWQYAEAGISKLQLVKPLQFLINVQKFKTPTSPGLRILRVTNWPLFIFKQLAIKFAVPRAFEQTHSLTSFGRAVGFLSDLTMCVAVKRWLFNCIFSLSLFKSIFATF